MAANSTNGFGFLRWAAIVPTGRLLIGAFVVVLVGLSGLTPKSVVGVDIVWPFAALWAAVGWGRVGLSLRVMLVLMLLGFAQDIDARAPLGVFPLINLLAYGMSAAIVSNLGFDDNPLVKYIAPIAIFITAFVALWAIASNTAGGAVNFLPFISQIFVTSVFYYLVQGVFDLGARPGARAGGG